MPKECVICGTAESEEDLLIEAPCERHWVCVDDIAAYFENATHNESQYPPQCCRQPFTLDVYEEYLPFEVAWAFQVKEQGEYSVLAKFRVYCANLPCNAFLHPETHIHDPVTQLTYAPCEAENCGNLTCTKCKTLIKSDLKDHICKQDEEVVKFQQSATEQGFKQCPVCAALVELADACNHVFCTCGNQFCYVCGKTWEGMHGCPHYGAAVYDEEGYNQDGFHRDTGLNRDGLTRVEEDRENFAGEGDNGEEHDLIRRWRNLDEHEVEALWEQVIPHLPEAMQAIATSVPLEERSEALFHFRMFLLDTQGLMFIPADLIPEEDGGQDEEQGGERDGELDGEQDAQPDGDEVDGAEINDHDPFSDDLWQGFGDIDPASEAETDDDDYMDAADAWDRAAIPVHWGTEEAIDPNLFDLDWLDALERNRAQDLHSDHGNILPELPDVSEEPREDDTDFDEHVSEAPTRAQLPSTDDMDEDEDL